MRQLHLVHGHSSSRVRARELPEVQSNQCNTKNERQKVQPLLLVPVTAVPSTIPLHASFATVKNNPAFVYDVRHNAPLVQAIA